MKLSMKTLAVLCAGLMTVTASAAPVKVIAHRGYWDTPGSAQNSIRSIVKADSIGCFGSEFDVWMSKDGHLFVNHDKVFKGVELQNAPAKTIREIILDNGERIPTLKEYLETANKLNGNMRLICEIKPHTDRAQESKAVKKILKEIEKQGLIANVDYITFSKEATKELIKWAPKGTPVYYLNGEASPAELKEWGATGLDYSIKVMKKHPEWFKEAHDLGLQVNVWTVNKPADMKWCIKMGADFITTNDPEKLQAIIKGTDK